MSNIVYSVVYLSYSDKVRMGRGSGFGGGWDDGRRNIFFLCVPLLNKGRHYILLNTDFDGLRSLRFWSLDLSRYALKKLLDHLKIYHDLPSQTFT